MADLFSPSFKQKTSRINPFVGNSRTNKRTITKFTEKMGLVYFGVVSQHQDDHHIVRGFTVSSSHHDNHYSIGSVDGYEVTLVDRTDTVRGADGKKYNCNWFIIEIKLQTLQDIPHIFIGTRNHDPKPYYTLFTTFPALKEVDLGTFEPYDSEFTSRYSIYAKPTQSIEVERLLPGPTTRVIGAHFWPFSAEIHERTVYMYSDNEKVTLNMTESLMEDGIWLAKHLDNQAELV